jgi:hypothetical protein
MDPTITSKRQGLYIRAKDNKVTMQSKGKMIINCIILETR